ncbi:hypothetical protein RFEPED_0481 [Rickettsia felis str. Pedreira]|uniref:Uncharacterized protein n=1 Tax=Rickettsia felis str. Pedreira TaxID=1359196 RepID=A0A0F3MQS0_RICFI|nr:hypothetical protein [Rickettsia felis]KHO03379.1 hypothetical protein JS55_00690 [Rickettsia felis str. LSU]KHO04051.1 hypothetical protein JS61_00645 [Rickettsia felis]KJV58108.1 hypothetical protein RFEPED_0481 [Rickettsia felis str. Pedreira]MDE8611106.1 hypothetical protein [Rickettsia felis]
MIIDEEDFDEITIEEDIALSKLADKRLKETKYWVKHEDAWGIPGIASEHCCVDTQSSLRAAIGCVAISCQSPEIASSNYFVILLAMTEN